MEQLETIRLSPEYCAVFSCCDASALTAAERNRRAARCPVLCKQGSWGKPRLHHGIRVRLGGRNTTPGPSFEKEGREAS